MNRLPPPPRRSIVPDQLDSDLREMVIAEERGFPRFPPPPRPPRTQRPELDVIQILARVAICIAFAIFALSLWTCTH